MAVWLNNNFVILSEARTPQREVLAQSKDLL